MSNPEESRLRGTALDGSDQRDAVDHAKFMENRTPDTELRVDDEDDSLYDDGLEIGDGSETLADTHGNVNKG